MVIWGHTIKYSFEKKKEEGGRGKTLEEDTKGLESEICMNCINVNQSSCCRVITKTQSIS